jgi:hypothetical protein
MNFKSYFGTLNSLGQKHFKYKVLVTSKAVILHDEGSIREHHDAHASRNPWWMNDARQSKISRGHQVAHVEAEIQEPRTTCRTRCCRLCWS